MAAMVAGSEVEFVWLLRAVMHGRDFEDTTTYPFSCMVFELYRSAGLIVWLIDGIKTPSGIVDVSLI